jgi:hypothetical protein
MGLLDDYGLDLSEVEAPSWDIEDGTYEFVVGDIFVKEGSTNYPDKSWIIIEYLVGDSGKKTSELFQLPADAANPTDKELTTLGRYKARLISLGIAESEVNNVGAEELVGIEGVFTLRTTTGKDKKEYQNIRNLKVADAGENSFRAPAEEAEAEEAPAPKKAPAARKAAAPAAPTAVKNPFAQR